MSAPIVNVAAHLAEMARVQPDTPAIVFPRRRLTLTFGELDQDTDRVARGLAELGVEAGTRTVLMVPPGPEFFALTFATLRLKAVPVLVDPGLGRRWLGRCLGEATPEVFIGIPKAHVARLLLGWARPTLRTLVTVGPRLGWGGVTLEDVRELGRGSGRVPPADADPEDIAAILFTSGSTGPPKGAVYRHGNFAAQVEQLRELYGIEPGEIDLPTFPLFGLFAPALGMTAVVPDMNFTRPADADPAMLVRTIREHSVTTMFGSPALVDRLGRHGARHGIRLPTLRRVICAGAPVQPVALARMTTMLSPGAQVHTPYGATEALPVASIGSDEILSDTRKGTDTGAGNCVGRPVPSVDVAVIEIRDEPIASWSDDLVLPAGSVGEIVVRGPQVTTEYHGRPEATALAKVLIDTSAIDKGGFWHRMGDLGYFDEGGRLWFCGRKSQRVVTREGTLFTTQCEGVFNAHPDVHRTALVGVRLPGDDTAGEGTAGDDTARPVLCVELDRQAGGDPRQVVRELEEIAAAHEHARQIRDFLVHPALPVDIRHNAKIFREKLATWATARLS